MLQVFVFLEKSYLLVRKLVILFLLCFGQAFFAAEKCKRGVAFVVMGPPCSGKTTLSKKLLNAWSKDNWALVELDIIEDRAKASGFTYSSDKLLALLLAEANQLLDKGHSIIVDTNVYGDQLRELLHARVAKFIFVYCPLSCMFERDKQRSRLLQRSSVKTERVLRWLASSFYKFQKVLLGQQYDLCINSANLSVQEETEMITALKSYCFRQ